MPVVSAAVNLIAESFGPFGTPELVILAVLVLALFGARKLPIFGRSLGQSMNEFRKAKEDFERELMNFRRGRHHDDSESLSDEEVERLDRIARPTFRPRPRLGGANVIVALAMLLCAVLLVIALARFSA